MVNVTAFFPFLLEEGHLLLGEKSHQKVLSTETTGLLLGACVLAVCTSSSLLTGYHHYVCL